MSARNTQRGAARHPAGFTLVEILVVVVILGIASAIIIPQIGSRDDLTAASAARVLMSDLIYAQNRAIATQKWQYVQFNGQRYVLYDQAPPASPNLTLAIENPVSLDPYTQLFSDPGTALAKVSLDSWNFGGPSVLMFDELGSPYAWSTASGTAALATSGTIVVKCGSASLTIDVEPFTGEMTVK